MVWGPGDGWMVRQCGVGEAFGLMILVVMCVGGVMVFFVGGVVGSLRKNYQKFH